MYRAFLTALMVVMSCVSAFAQTRVAPAPNTTSMFVAQVESGAAGNFRLISLRGEGIYNEPRAANDLLIYNFTTGQSWFVRNYGPVYGVPNQNSGYALSEQGCPVNLPAGLTLIASDVDGDGRDDLVGHHPSTGQFYRFYQRNADPLSCPGF